MNIQTTVSMPVAGWKAPTVNSNMIKTKELPEGKKSKTPEFFNPYIVSNDRLILSKYHICYSFDVTRNHDKTIR